MSSLFGYVILNGQQQHLKDPADCIYMVICLYVHVTTMIKEKAIHLGEECGHKVKKYEGGDIIIF